MTVSECGRAIAAIEGYGDGELGRARGLLLRRHARRCSHCGSYLGKMKVVVRALDGMKHMTAPDDLLKAVMACLVGTYTPDREASLEVEYNHRNLFLVAGAAGLGLAAVALAIVRWVLSREREEGLAPVAPA